MNPTTKRLTVIICYCAIWMGLVLASLNVTSVSGATSHLQESASTEACEAKQRYRADWAEIFRYVSSKSQPSTHQETNKQQQATDPIDEVTALFERGMRVFKPDGESGENAMLEAARYLGKVLEHPDATKTQKYTAGFHRVAALSNAKQHQAALEAAEDFQRQFDQGPELLSFMMADAHWHLGNPEKARRIWKSLLENNPDTPLKAMIQSKLGLPIDGGGTHVGSPQFPPEKKLPYTTAGQSSQFAAGQKQGYLVVTVGLDSNNLDHQRFQDVARQVKRFHRADLIAFDGKDFQQLRGEIKKIKPANVLFVMPPQLLDVNFHRQVFKIAPTLDNDLQADFCWGYLTARDGHTVQKFWQRIVQLHKNGFKNNQWLQTAVASNIKSTVYEHAKALSPAARAAGFTGKQLYYGSINSDPDVLQFVDERLREMELASVVVMTGNGDPQGVWLFDGQRNMQPNKHWKFDKAKVGYDPNNELIRIKADRFRALNLQSSIVWSGTCHSGACFRVFVESDIVSTFGTSDKIEVYELKPDESMCLALIDAGAGSLLVPVASNHGFSASLETHFAVTQGATLGETIKATYDDVYLQAGGVPALAIVKEGEPDAHFREPTMQGTGANRILIGDPALALFTKSKIPIEPSSIKLNDDLDGMTINLEWQDGFHPEAWNIYADASGRDNRMRIRIPWPQGVDIPDSNSIKVTTRLETGGSKQLSSLPVFALEQYSGKTYLHLQATTHHDGLLNGHHRVTFHVKW